MATLSMPTWPNRYRVMGVPVSCTNYAEAVDCLMTAATMRQPALATAFAVHGVVEASKDQEFLREIMTFDLVVPDGQPVRYALNLLHRAQLDDRVYGPTLMLKLCEAAAAKNVNIYLYGSTRDTVDKLRSSLFSRFPTLSIVGAEPSLFRALTEDELAALSTRIAQAKAGLVFLGLGCPRQERFAYTIHPYLDASIVCVGAAFDFHAGTKRQAPKWMQDCSLEWFFRLIQEPRRLFKRYAVTNTLFAISVSTQILVGWFSLKRHTA
jgi:N-acetylglucosaminyldiphosphoundecaprenol N-acetyl-beta-D-mannosaminyltransferase